MPIYIYTVPKSGTYFLAALLASLGYNDTGYHVDEHAYLDTHARSPEENVSRPSSAEVPEHYLSLLGRIGGKDVVFGHFPLPLRNDEVLTEKRFSYVCSYRDPHTTLMSEFIDFRFRRVDVEEYSRESIRDDREAFRAYLRQHGLVHHLAVFRDMTSLLERLMDGSISDPSPYFFVDFDSLIKQRSVAARLCRFVAPDKSDDEIFAAFEHSKTAENKTKATALSIDRGALWSEEAEREYAASPFPDIWRRLKQLVLEFAMKQFS